MNMMKKMIYLLLSSVLFALQLDAQELENGFSQQEITDALFVRIKGKSYKDNCTTSLSDLRYLQVLHYNTEGEVLKGELICHQSISEDLLTIFRELYKAKYPIERMVLVDEYDADDEASMQANNSSAFNFRYVSGTKSLSRHSRGMAIDINPLYNPYVRQRNGRTVVEPTNAEAYVDRTKDFPYKIVRGDLCYRLFKKYGFIWGGDWKNSKDYQHFEKK